MVTVQSQAKFHKTGVKCEAFLRMFMKFYLADTPHRRNARILKVGSEQIIKEGLLYEEIRIMKINIIEIKRT